VLVGTESIRAGRINPANCASLVWMKTCALLSWRAERVNRLQASNNTLSIDFPLLWCRTILVVARQFLIQGEERIEALQAKKGFPTGCAKD